MRIRLVVTMLLVGLSVAMSGCQTAPPAPEVEGPWVQDPIYPWGLYSHRVRLEMRQGDQVKKQEVTAMIRSQRNRFAAALLGPMGVTLATFEEHLGTHERKVKIAMKNLRQHEKNVEQFFVLLKDLILFPRRESKVGPFHVVERDPAGQPVKLRFESEFGVGDIQLASYSGQGPAAWPQRLTIESARFRSEADVKQETN